MRRARADWPRAGIPSAGLWVGPVAWLVSLEAKYALVPWACAGGLPLIHPVTLLTVLVVAFGGYLSWRAWAASGEAAAGTSSGGGRPHRMLAGIGVLAASLFLLLILLQGAAAFVFDGCER